MYVSARERKILELLLHAQEEMRIKEIAVELQVSERTIHRDLTGIEKLIFDHNLELLKKSGSGLRITGDRMNKQQLEAALSGASSSDYTLEERQTIILAALLEAKEPMKLFTLANELKVTIATISHDLDQLEEELAKFNLHLVRKRGYGVRIEGNETNKRSAISNLIAKNVDPFEFVSLLKENLGKKLKQPLTVISNRLLGMVNPETLTTIENRVEQTRNQLPHELADSAFIGLVVHLTLAIERLQKGDKIEFDQAFMKQIEGTKEYEIAKQLIQDLEISLSMEIPDDEIGYITMHLMGAKLRIDHHYLIEDSSLDIAYKTKQLISYVESHMGMDLSNNASLLNDLAAHLKPMIYRLKQGMNITNPLIKEIKKDYPDLFQLIREGVQEIFSDMKFPDDETAFLVLHFAAALLHGEEEFNLKTLVVCSSGIGTAKILSTKLVQRVPEIKQVDNKSLFDLKHLNPDDYDIVVSTIPLKEFAGEYILASPILTKAEAHRIKKVIRKKKLAYKTYESQNSAASVTDTSSTDYIPQFEAMQNYTKAIVDLLSSFRVEKITEESSITSILRMVCNELEVKELIQNQENILDRLLKREQIGGLGIPNTSLALFHARSMDVVSPNFSIYSLNHPITILGMDGESMEMDTLLVMLAPEVTHQEVLEVLSYLSSLLIQGQENIDLFESGNETQIKQFLSSQFQKFLQEKNLLSN
ncbi:transcriptional antiterminator [Virgibacillus phasianinus]|uniref:Transcriptional antiterminator n=1 Tax=Virgibacillus phasianinus TaxID=2017483 RepID=A0A220U3F1_9BACI|nr:transcriptional antiterminator [Virgibacillus phasianinus]